MKIPSHFDPASFLSDYWQKKPLVIRNALSPALFPLTPEELAGLACEEGIESRLIRGELADGFELQHGPFTDADFLQLPGHNWTLLVQAVDHYLPEVAELLEYFRFIPNWRIDDIMVSYAKQGGSAGPHYDNYDVFLIQGAGTRRWQIGAPVDQSPALIPHDSLRLLSDFKATEEWELQPGDILYLPPRYAHWGIASNSQCMTYSIGFRTPSLEELLAGITDYTLYHIDEELHYQDPDLKLQANPGLMSQSAIDALHTLVLERLSDRDSFRQWLGGYVTAPKYPVEESPVDTPDLATLRSALHAERHHEQASVIRDAASRFAFTRQDDTIELYIDARRYVVPATETTFAEQLCDHAEIPVTTLLDALDSPLLSAIVLELFAKDILYFRDELQD